MSKGRPYDEDSHRSDDLQRLFEQTRPVAREVDIQEIIGFSSKPLARSRTSEEPGRKTFFTRRWSMSTRAVALAAIAAGVFCLVVVPLISVDGFAFAEVKQEVEKIRTVEYVETSLDGEPPAADPATVSFGAPRGASGEPTLEKAIAQRERRLKTADSELAKDLEFELEALKRLREHEARILYVRRVRVKGKYLERVDGIFPIGRHHNVRSALNGLNVSFDHQAKKKTILTKQVVIQNSGTREESNIKKIPPTVDFFARFRSVPSKAAESLPAREIDGKEVIGFRSTEEYQGKTWTRTYWVLPDSKLPVEMWTEVHQGTQLQQRWVMNQFVFDRELGDALFSTATPEGYTSAEGTIYGYSGN